MRFADKVAQIVISSIVLCKKREVIDLNLIRTFASLPRHPEERTDDRLYAFFSGLEARLMLLLIAALFTLFLIIGMPVAFSLMLSSIPVFVLTGTMPTTVAIQNSRPAALCTRSS